MPKATYAIEARESEPIDSGLFVLELLFRLQRIDVTPGQLQRYADRGILSVAEMLCCAKEFGLHARCLTAEWTQLARSPMPAIAALRRGGFMLLGKTTDERAVILVHDAVRPAVVTRAEFEALWDGRLVLVTKPSWLANCFRRSVMNRLLNVAVERVGRPRRHLTGKAVDFGTHFARATIIGLADRARNIRQAAASQIFDRSGRPGDEIAFLPAALEIVETPPSPLGRAITFTVIAIFSIALVWAYIGTVDIVAIAPGKIIPSGRTKTIQPFESGVVRAIRVEEGQHVKADDVLIELDATMSDAELSRLKSDLMSARLTAARLRGALAETDDSLSAFTPPDDAPPVLIQQQHDFLVSETTEQKAKLAVIDRQVAQKEAERATVQASIEKLKTTLTPLQQRVDIREQLFNKGLGSKLEYLTELQQLVGQKQDILVQQSHYNETDAAVAALLETRAKTVAEYRRGLFDELDKAQQKSAALVQDVIKAERLTSLRRLTAPVDGVVQQLAIHTIGGVVTPAQTLMFIVPVESPLEIEATISNRDIGFVDAGQDAEIKVDTFNFTRYGLLHGRVLAVSQDAITRDKPQDKGSNGAPATEASSGESKSQELTYSARISVDRSEMDVDNRHVNLLPGMTVNVEIRTGSRRIIDYLLSPIMRYKHDSLRER